MSDFREDGALALEWVASYLERAGELPVLSQVEPGAIRAALPAAAPDDPEPFSAVVGDLDSILLPGITHWQSPRFFAYFATTGSEPGVLAELLVAGLNQVGILWRTSPALQELEEVTVDWLRQLVGLPAEFRGHIEDTASTGVLAAAIVARSLTPDRRVLVCSEHAHSVGEKAARLLGLELRKVPTDDVYRMRPRPDARARRLPRSRDDRDDGHGVARPGAGDRRTLRRSGDLAARRRRLRGVGRDPSRAARSLRRLGARRLDRREPAQVAGGAHGLLRPVDAQTGGVPKRLQPRSRVPALARRRAQPERGLDSPRTTLPCTQALGGAPLLRAARAPGAPPRAPSPGTSSSRAGCGPSPAGR